MGEAAEAWGAGWSSQGGRLELPVTAGLRHGLLEARVWTEAGGDGSRVVLRVERAVWRLHVPSVAILLFAAVGALGTVLWPFFPQLLPLVPFGAIVALGAWFLVISRLRTSGAEDFLALVEEVSHEKESHEEVSQGSGGGAGGSA